MSHVNYGWGNQAIKCVTEASVAPTILKTSPFCSKGLHKDLCACAHVLHCCSGLVTHALFSMKGMAVRNVSAQKEQQNDVIDTYKGTITQSY